MFKKITLVMVLVMLLMLFSFKTFATNEFLVDVTNSANNITNTGNVANNVVNNTVNNTVNNVVNNTSNTSNYANNATNQASGLPQTGINSSIIFIIAIFAVSALYAYKKIKDYNN